MAVHGHPRSSTLVAIESAYATSYYVRLLVISSYFGYISYCFRDVDA